MYNETVLKTVSAEQKTMFDMAYKIAMSPYITNCAARSLYNEHYLQLLMNHPLDHTLQTTKGGFAVEFRDQRPYTILMPGGSWQVWGFCYRPDNFNWELMLDYLGAKTFKEAMKYNRTSTIGPIYAISKVGDLSLPIFQKREIGKSNPDFPADVWEALMKEKRQLELGR